MQGATKAAGNQGGDQIVSIHAPYAGSDSISYISIRSDDVSIHAPYAGSDGFLTTNFPTASWFQSTPPMQGATV